MECDADLKANELMDSLTAGQDFVIPAIDIDGPMFQYPGTETGELFNDVSRITIDDLTTREVGGTGAFDAMMEAGKAHLRLEYDNNRISGAEYTKAYIALIQGAMANATQFLLGREEVFWRAQQGQIEAIGKLTELEMQKIKVKAAFIEANTIKANYAKTKISLATEDVTYCLASFELNEMKPAQLTLITSENAKAEAEVIFMDARTDNIVAETGLIPLKSDLLSEQVETQRAETLDTRTDGVTVVAGSKGKQKDLYSQQITAYQRDSEVKAAKIFSDAWITQKTIDEGLLAPNGFTNESIDQVLTLLKTSNGFLPSTP